MSKLVIFANGKAQQVSEEKSVEKFVQEMGLKSSMVFVELNGQALLRGEWSNAYLQHGDRLEVMRVVAGG
ncbi:MAG: sulfur carrier protein ThiS [Verrucomicrobiota bacterium]